VDKRDALRNSRLDIIARKKLSANNDYYLPEELKSHIVKKYFEVYALEAEEFQSKVEEKDGKEQKE